MIYVNGKEIPLVYCGEKAISAIMRGSRSVWQAIRSCFGSGFWVNKKGWINDEGFKILK